MKKVIIVHGWDGSPKEGMHSWMKKELEKKGFEVMAPKMPSPAKPQIETWIPFLQKTIKGLDKDTYFIGHSIGCQGVLRYLETQDKEIGGIVLIAPWMHLDLNTIAEEGEESVKIAKPWMEIPINWVKINKLTKKCVCIFSNNDPYVPLEEKEIFMAKLNAKIIVEKNKGHFTEDDGVRENKTAVEALLAFVKK